MLVLLSPSKTQDFTTPAPIADYTLPQCLKQSEILIQALRPLSVSQIGALMDVSPKIATLNAERYEHFSLPFTPANAKQALFSFKGDVYTDIDSDHYTKDDITFAQSHVRILSGLYGYLRPLDLIQPYRLEMKIKLPTASAKDLYKFWDDKITNLLNTDLQMQARPAVINLASIEYFSSIQVKKIKAPMITPFFKEYKNGSYKIIALFAKRARGAMTNYIIKHRIDEPEALKNFTESGYAFNPALSSPHDYVFTR